MFFFFASACKEAQVFSKNLANNERLAWKDLMLEFAIEDVSHLGML